MGLWRESCIRPYSLSPAWPFHTRRIGAYVFGQVRTPVQVVRAHLHSCPYMVKPAALVQAARLQQQGGGRGPVSH